MTIICCLKLTHDASVSVFNNENLIFCVEVEKLNNNPRYSTLHDLAIIPKILKNFNIETSDIDEWIIDGWDGLRESQISVSNNGVEQILNLAPYYDDYDQGLMSIQAVKGNIELEQTKYKYKSYTHVVGHIFSAYSTSPFAKRGEDAYVIVWDGGMFLRLYKILPKTYEVVSLGVVINAVGHFYATAGLHFGPMKTNTPPDNAENLSVAGKLMAYIALGKKRQVLIDLFFEIYDELFVSGVDVRKYLNDIKGCGTSVESSVTYLNNFFQRIKARICQQTFSDEDILTSMHYFLQELLLKSTIDKIQEYEPNSTYNLCISGGCALNIKWNSAFRSQPRFKDVWVAPFPNDSGASIGMGAAHLFTQNKTSNIQWNVHQGIEIQEGKIQEGWSKTPCTVKELAKILYDIGQPVLCLNDRAELGPRALGNRSIIAPATSLHMKALLNNIKKREEYRPVAPICLEQYAQAIFNPGTADPYMLFDHYIRPQWINKIPAVKHLDGTARLQTVNEDDNPMLYALLEEYYMLSGIPVLCNTSANYNGSGFFPDIESAMIWGKVSKIWSKNHLYSKNY